MTSTKRYNRALTAERLREVLDYDPATGVFRWIKPTSRRVRPGTRAGWAHSCGYQKINVDGSKYFSHQLAWLHVYGKWSLGDLDHINGDRSDARIGNLRPASRTQNNGNSRRPRNNTSGLKGARFHKGARKWLAQINCDGRYFYLGLFETREQAHAAYLKAAEGFFGQFKNGG